MAFRTVILKVMAEHKKVFLLYFLADILILGVYFALGKYFNATSLVLLIWSLFAFVFLIFQTIHIRTKIITSHEMAEKTTVHGNRLGLRLSVKKSESIFNQFLSLEIGNYLLFIIIILFLIFLSF